MADQLSRPEAWAQADHMQGFGWSAMTCNASSAEEDSHVLSRCKPAKRGLMCPVTGVRPAWHAALVGEVRCQACC